MHRTVKIALLLTLVFYFANCKQERTDHVTQFGEYSAWSVKIADSEIKRRGDSLMLGGSDPKAKWRYTTGLFLQSLLDLWQATGNHKYYEYVQNTIDSFVKEDGNIAAYKMSDFNLDKINSGKVLLRLYRETGDEKYRQATEVLYTQLQNQPRTSEGGFWHKKRYPWQMWLDGIYMSGPFYAEYGLMFEKEEALEDVLTQIRLIDTHTRDAETGLRYHGWDESREQAWADSLSGCSPHFWGRAMGWYAMALVDLLDFIPAEDIRREQVLEVLNDLLKSVKKYQDESGLWYQIVNLSERPGNYLESSCTAMFVYTMAKALNNGYIDNSFRAATLAGYKGLIANKLKSNDNDSIRLSGICGVAGLGGNPYRDGSFGYYISEPIVSNDLKGVGPFIMAGLQMEKLLSKQAP